MGEKVAENRRENAGKKLGELWGKGKENAGETAMETVGKEGKGRKEKLEKRGGKCKKKKEKEKGNGRGEIFNGLSLSYMLCCRWFIKEFWYNAREN